MTMNNRIRELAEQAGFGLHRDGEIYTSRLEHLPITEDIEKFAELIVRECMAVTVNYPHPVTKLTAAEHIARHFGVEE